MRPILREDPCCQTDIWSLCLDRDLDLDLELELVSEMDMEKRLP
jgi:hypothetical protein